MSDDERVRRRVVYVRLAIGLAIGGALLVARWRWNRLVAGHVPYVDYDTRMFTQIAELPFGVDLLFAPKPFVVPFVYRLAGNDTARVVAIQEVLAFAAWSILSVTLALGRRRAWLRPLAGAAGLAFLFAPTRVGFTASLLTESIDDSLLALVVASALALVHLRLPRGDTAAAHVGVADRRRVDSAAAHVGAAEPPRIDSADGTRAARIAAAISLGLFGALWIATRDTNAFIAIAAAGLATLIWRRRAWIPAAATTVVATGALATTCVAHEPLPYQDHWYERFTPRGTYPMVDNLAMRVDDLRDELPSELATTLDEPIVVEHFIRTGPRPLQDWFVDHGAGVYARWLVRHPFDRIGELVDDRWNILASSLGRYMPKGWHAGGSVLRRITRLHGVLLLLIIAAPLALRHPRADPTCGVALVMIASGVVGVAASYYGDAAEVYRHCYGAGQQIVLGLFVAALAWLDRTTAIRSACSSFRRASSFLRARWRS